MHEYSPVQALSKREECDARACGTSAVHRVTVRIGRASLSNPRAKLRSAGGRPSAQEFRAQCMITDIPARSLAIPSAT